MSRATRCLSSVILLGLAACGGVRGTNDSHTAGASEERAMPAAADLAPCWPCLVAPDTANPAMFDPAIGRDKQWLSDHYVWLDPAVEHREKLFVYLPGQRNTPSQFNYLAREAAQLGYHVIALMFSNTVGVGGGPDSICKFTTYDKAAEACQENVRLEVLDGKAHGPVRLVFSSMSAERADAQGIYSRLTKLLEHLALTRPGEGWSEFLRGRGTERAPAWQKIVIGGISYGGSEAALIAKLHRVHRVTLFAAPRDGFQSQAPSSPPCTGSASAAIVPAFVTLGKTPSKRYYGLVHAQDPLQVVTFASWEKLGMCEFGPPVREDLSMTSPPYDKTHILLTNRPTLPDQKAGTTTFANAHGSVVNDQFTPLDDPNAVWPAGTPLLGEVWRYMLGGHGAEGEDDSGDDSFESGNEAE
jgi:hypothetical protein